MTEPSRPSPSTLTAAVELLGRGKGSALFHVQGDSMLPTLASGGRVEVDLAPRTPAFGDLILFRQNDYVVIHRYLGAAADRAGARCLRTRGDATTRLDPPLSPDRLLGIARSIERPDGWRQLRGAKPRAYAIAAAAHDLAWAAVHVILERTGAGSGLRSRLERADRGVLAAADRAFFRLLHPRGPAPAEAPDAGAARAD